MKSNDKNQPYFSEDVEHREVVKSMGLLDFVWDDAKNQHNIKIHHVDFETAMLVFNDEERIMAFFLWFIQIELLWEGKEFG